MWCQWLLTPFCLKIILEYVKMQSPFGVEDHAI